MKTKLKFFILTFILFPFIIVSCNSSNNSNNEETKKDNEKIKEGKTENKTDQKLFNTFEDYAKILSKKELVTEFGEDNLKDGVQYYAEGTVVVESTTLINPQNGHVIIYDWNDAFKTSSIKANYSIRDDKFKELGTQKIKTESGLYLGMSLADLRKWNGANFKFSGFDWDFAGGIYRDEGSKIFKSGYDISLYMLNEGFDFAIGDVELNADDKKLKDAGIIIGQLMLYAK